VVCAQNDTPLLAAILHHRHRLYFPSLLVPGFCKILHAFKRVGMRFAKNLAPEC
jgi:hypothetical protein